MELQSSKIHFFSKPKAKIKKINISTIFFVSKDSSIFFFDLTILL